MFLRVCICYIALAWKNYLPCIEKFVVRQENDGTKIPDFRVCPRGTTGFTHPNKGYCRDTAVVCSRDYKEYDKKEGGTLKRRRKNLILWICSFYLMMITQ